MSPADGTNQVQESSQQKESGELHRPKVPPGKTPGACASLRLVGHTKYGKVRARVG